MKRQRRLIGCLLVFCLCFYAFAEDETNYDGFEASPEAYNLLPNGQNPPSTSNPNKTKVFDPYAGPPGFDATPKAPPAPPKKRGFFSAGKLDPPPKPPPKEPPSKPREYPASLEPLCRLGVSIQGDTPNDVLKSGVYRVFTYGGVVNPKTNAVVGLPSRLELWEHGKKRLTVGLSLMPHSAEPVTTLPPPPADAPKEGMLNQGVYRQLKVVARGEGDFVVFQYQLGDFYLESTPVPVVPVWE